MILPIGELNRLLACPKCLSSISVIHGKDCECNNCGAKYHATNYSWDFTAVEKPNPEMWEAWDLVQQNGVVSYTKDPEHNLGVGQRADYRAFGHFCKFHGIILDVGCGPQPWPSHFCDFQEGTYFIGVDPLVGEHKADYIQIKGLGEFLPFKESSFDQVLFATSLDHFINPMDALKEAKRVCRPSGVVNVWLGEKSLEAPPPTVSHDWYMDLVKPEKAEDVFHLKRLTFQMVSAFAKEVGLKAQRHEMIRVDDYRVNHFISFAAED